MRTEPIKCVCPACQAIYRVPARAVGHRARCHACGTIFRLGEKPSRRPTEDDIIRWLREAEDQDEAAIERREAASDVSTARSNADSEDNSPQQRRSA